ncbi:hypothetical protein [Acuticoccus yangtzensis]|nr:hypothetical protein [Acuticoccus yangtzensis]
MADAAITLDAIAADVEETRAMMYACLGLAAAELVATLLIVILVL